MMKSSTLCEELYETLIKNLTQDNFKLTFAPDQLTITTRYFVEEKQNHTEIVCFKSSLLSVFKEAHNYFSIFQSSSSIPLNKDTYYCTIGFLLSTPENKTALNVHEDVFLEILQKNDYQHGKNLVFRELRLIERLLTSSNNRLNKSSSLWFLYKKLYIISKCRYPGIDYEYTHIFVNSAKHHTSNYYCWNAAKWFFDNVPTAEQQQLLEETQRFCFQNISDCSAWSAFTYMLTQETGKCIANKKDFLRLQNRYDISTSNYNDTEWSKFDIESIYLEVLKHVDLVTITERPPFLCILALMKRSDNINPTKVLETWNNEISQFEKEYGSIEFLRNNVIVPDEYSDNMIISKSFMHLGNKKYVLNVLSNEERR